MKKHTILAGMLLLALALSGCQGTPQTTSTTSPVTEAATQETVAATEEITATEAPTGSPTPTEEPARVMLVTTEQDVVDGDTTDFDSLEANPGSDGLISLREAVQAANQTTGRKQIDFSSDLAGTTIYLGKAQQYEEPRLWITGDQLTVNGDVDGDGVSDILLDGSKLNINYSMAFILNASQLVIENLQFNGFQQFAIGFACVDDACGNRSYEGIVIQNNTIFSDVGGGGVILTPLKIVSGMADPTLFSNIVISDFQVLNNSITVSNGGNGGIFIMAAGAGGSDNHLSDILIQGNTVSSPGVTITVNGGDGSSAYFQFPGEEKFSDRNVVERVSILSNVLNPVGIGGDSARPSGIVFVAGNYGNSDNVIRDVVIENNEVSSNAEHLLVMYATSNGIVAGLPMTSRAATGNIIENVEIVGNISHADTTAFTLIACNGEDPSPMGATGSISHVWIHANEILDYKWEGIDIFAGAGESNSLIEDVVIEDNTFTALDITKGQALFIYAGGCSNCTRPSDNNQILDLVIRNNIVNSNDFIFMYGGMEEFASNNLVTYYLGENTLNPIYAKIDIADFMAKENAGNQTIALEEMP